MFTGLVQTTGTVAAIERTNSGVALSIQPPFPPTSPEWVRPFELGESIAVNGCCLTLARLLPSSSFLSPSPTPHPLHPLLAFDVIPESLAKTALGSLAPGSGVNLERAATPLTFLGGHIVQGHIDGLARVLGVLTTPEWRVRFAPAEPAMMQYLIPKGCVCVDGVSLTIAALNIADAWFEVALIPTTLDQTTLRTLSAGDLVNLELDAMTKTIVHYLQHFSNRAAP